MNSKYTNNLKYNLDRARQEREQRFNLKSDLLVMCITLGSIILFIVIV